MSPIARVAKILTRFDFRELETGRSTIYPTVSFRGMLQRTSITLGDVSSKLAPDQQTIYEDHREFPCEHALLEHGGRQCYMVFVRKPRRFLSSANVEYLSDPELFRSCIRYVAGRLCRKLRVSSLSVPRRFLGDARIPFSRPRQLKVPYMFRSDSLEPSDIDGLYTECLVMGF